MTEYDSPWKEILDKYFAEFMQLCFPELYQAIDWVTPTKMLDKEFQQIAQESETGQRTVDKLVEVRLLTGQLEWLLVHLEIQSQSSDFFARRMFVYYYRITDKYNKPVDRSQWKLRLLKPLYRRGMSRETIRDLFRVIDWMMDLPRDIALQFENELLLFEQEKHMPYVTSIERHGMEKGELMGQIRLYQQLLGQPEQPRDQVVSQTMEALQSQLSQLQQSFASRKKE